MMISANRGALKGRAIGALVLTAALGLSACAQGGRLNNQTIGAGLGAVGGALIGSTIGSGGGNTAAIIVGGLIGALVGSEIGRSMDERDRLIAAQTTNAALESGASGGAVEWRNPESGATGFVTPAEPFYNDSGDVCREYTHSVIIEGRRETVRGVACRNDDGTWTNIG